MAKVSRESVTAKQQKARRLAGSGFQILRHARAATGESLFGLWLSACLCGGGGVLGSLGSCDLLGFAGFLGSESC